jgi:hypothetical protein
MKCPGDDAHEELTEAQDEHERDGVSQYLAVAAVAT